MPEPESGALRTALAAARLIGWSGLGVIVILALTVGAASDAHAYWLADPLTPYRLTLDEPGAYLYSPAFVQALSPLTVLPWEVFRALWLIAGVAALVWMVGPILGLLLVLPGPYSPVLIDLWTGNINIFIAAAVVAVTRHPAAWSFILLTKITPGAAMIWHVVRGEWKALAYAIGATATITAISFIIAPSAWFSWVDVLQGSVDQPVRSHGSSAALIPRICLAGAFATLGARRGWRWTLPVAITVSQPVLWYAALTILVALIPLYVSAGASATTPARHRRWWATVQAVTRSW